MLYCFVQEDMIHLDSFDPMFLQIEYASQLGRYGMLNTEDGAVYDQMGMPIDISGQEIFLRATCDSMFVAAELLTLFGGFPLNATSDIFKINHWNELGLTKRKVHSITLQKVKDGDYTEEERELLENHRFVFLKSRRKGFYLNIPSRKLLEKDRRFMLFLEEECMKLNEDLLLTDSLTIGKDEIGRLESRHFVVRGEIANSSRMVYMEHSVPESHVEKAKEIIEKLNQIEGFPKNYVLDIGEFVDNGESYVDLVEINSILNASCFINNSIFERGTGMGPEFVYDSNIHPERYQSGQC